MRYPPHLIWLKEANDLVAQKFELGPDALKDKQTPKRILKRDTHYTGDNLRGDSAGPPHIQSTPSASL